MKSRSKKYFETIKSNKPVKAETVKATQANPAKQATSASQDDTGGGNDSGKRIDEN